MAKWECKVCGSDQFEDKDNVRVCQDCGASETLEKLSSSEMEEIYLEACELINPEDPEVTEADCEKAIEMFREIVDYKDAAEKIKYAHMRSKEIHMAINEERRQRKAEIEAKRYEEERIRKAKQAKFLKRFAVVFTALALVTALTLYLALDIIPNYKYKKSHYDAAITAIADGDYVTAYENFSLIPDFKDSAAKLEEIKPNYYQTLVDTAKVGSYFYLGQYEQDNDLENGKEDVSWRVLAVDGTKLFVVSEYVLDARYYDRYPGSETCWENSEMREWLNGEFYNNIFSSKEQNYVLTTTVEVEAYSKYPDTYVGNPTEDKLFLLSEKEVQHLFSSTKDRRAWPTEYAIARGVKKYPKMVGNMHEDNKLSEGEAMYALRTPGKANKFALAIISFGEFATAGFNGSVPEIGVRPAMWIDASLIDFVG